jgi:toxin ParE1/3/4
MIRFLPEAEAELLRGVEYYSAAGGGAGSKFLRDVEVAVEMAATHPDSAPLSSDGTRRRRVKNFPYSVIYRVVAEEILIVAVAHHRRKPDYWTKRI